MSIKGCGQTLYIGRENISILETLEKDKKFPYENIRLIEYQFADNSRYGFMRFKMNSGDRNIFVYKAKSNEPMSRAVDYIHEKHPNLTILEVEEPFNINNLYSLWSLKKRLLPVLIIAVFFISCIVYSFNMIYDNPADTYITLEQYNSCKTGMSYEECLEIIGYAGEPLAESEIADTNTSAYLWHGDSLQSSNAIFYFMNGKLYSKTQLGLN